LWTFAVVADKRAERPLRPIATQPTLTQGKRRICCRKISKQLRARQLAPHATPAECYDEPGGDEVNRFDQQLAPVSFLISSTEKHMSHLKLNQATIFAATLIAFALGSLTLNAQTRKKPVYYSVAANTVLRARLDTELNSEKSYVGQTFSSTLVDPLYSRNGVLLAPQGSKVMGRVTAVQRARKNGEPATMDVQFYSLHLPNAVHTAINGSLTELDASGARSDNEGTVSAKKTSHRKVKFIGGGAAGGAVIGAIAGGGKGAAIGAGIGAVTGLIGGRVKKGHEVKVKSGTEFGVITNRAVSMRAYKAT
jgi:YmgG-like glycine-zipper protein